MFAFVSNIDTCPSHFIWRKSLTLLGYLFTWAIPDLLCFIIYLSLVNTFSSKFLFAKLLGPSHGNFVYSIALKHLLTLVFIICQNTHSTNTTYAFNSWLQTCKWFGELVFITLVMTSSDDLCHWAKITDV